MGLGFFQPCQPFQTQSLVPFTCRVLFDNYPIGAHLIVGENSSFWTGTFGGLQDGVAVLTSAQLFSNIGTRIDGVRPIVRIPCNQITFVST